MGKYTCLGEDTATATPATSSAFDSSFFFSFSSLLVLLLLFAPLLPLLPFSVVAPEVEVEVCKKALELSGQQFVMEDATNGNYSVFLLPLSTLPAAVALLSPAS